MAATPQDYKAPLYTLPTTEELFTNDSLTDSTVDIIKIHDARSPRSGQRMQTPKSWTYTYISTIGRPVHSSNPHNGDHSSVRKLVKQVFSERESNGRSTTPLIWVAEDKNVALSLRVNLASADRMARRWDRAQDDKSGKKSRKAIAYTYGVVELQQKRPEFTASWLLFYTQVNVLHVLRNYGLSRDHTAWNRKPSWVVKMIDNPSTMAYVFMLCMYLLVAQHPYFVNQGDEYQQLCVGIGLATGILLSMLSSFAEPGLPFPMYIVAGTASASLFLSMCGHWVWRTYLSTRDQRLERKLVRVEGGSAQYGHGDAGNQAS